MGRRVRNKKSLNLKTWLLLAAGTTILIASLLTVWSLNKPITTSSEAAQRKNTNLIIGGNDATEGEFPYVVTFIYRSNLITHLNLTTNLSEKSFCAGTLISPYWVVTAAHCSNLMGAGIRTMVAVGFTKRSSPVNLKRRFIEVKKAYVHENYLDGDDTYDIALIRLASPVYIQAYPKTSTNQKYYTDGEELTILGWGSTSETALKRSDNLKWAHIYKIEKDYLHNIGYKTPHMPGYPYSDKEYIDLNHKIFAGIKAGGIGTCKGDSGGPLLYKNGKDLVIIGVTSSGNGCALKDNPGEYVSVGALASWIEDTTNNQVKVSN